MLSPKEVANRLGSTEGTVKQWIHHKTHCGPLFRKLGTKNVMLEADLENYINNLPFVGDEKK